MSTTETKVGHTPGPWDVTEHHDVRVGPYMTMAPGESAQEIRANARLIASSPMLLAEATEALAMLEHLWNRRMEDRVPDMERWNDAMKGLRRAIEEATGDRP